MPTVAELTEPYGNFMLGRVRGPGVCEVCLTFTDGYPRCYTCARRRQALDAVAPISYSVAAGQLHHVLATYKRLNGGVGRRPSTQLRQSCGAFCQATSGASRTPPACRHSTSSQPCRPGTGGEMRAIPCTGS